jgi:hypothetical protein
MEALQKLAAMKQEVWAHQFLVAGPNARLDWKESPMRQYASFKDFYAREIEATFGKWENLQRTWSNVVKGKITEEEGRTLILGKHGGDRRSEQARADQGGEQAGASTLKPSQKNTKAHWLGRLDRDRPDLAAKVRAKTMSANAAAEEAGFRKKRERKKTTPLERILKLLPSLSDADCTALREALDARERVMSGAILSQVA